MNDVPDDLELHPWLRRPLQAVAIAVVLPFRLAWEAIRLLGRAVSWLARAAYRWSLRPAALAGAWLGRAIGRWVLVPAALALAWLGRTGWRLIARLAGFCYRRLLRPIGHAVAWLTRTAHREIVAPAGRMTRVVGHWLRPAAVIARGALAAVGLRRRSPAQREL